MGRDKDRDPCHLQDSNLPLLILLEFGFQCARSGLRMFIHRPSQGGVVLLLYVDDLYYW